MQKNAQLNAWLWKWHVIAGLITLPFMLLLALTGVIYMFKDDLNHYLYRDTLVVKKIEQNTLPLSEQYAAAQRLSSKAIASVVLNTSADQTTAFKVSGGRAANVVYVDPYTAEVTGEYQRKQTFMYLVRKLHGELLLDTPGTYVVELVASWFIVLILTGFYVWWPKPGSNSAGFFTVRVRRGKRIFWRDIHAVLGFWLSAFMLIIIAGGMPWTDVFGTQLKWVQKQTNTGYPEHWRNSKGLHSNMVGVDSGVSSKEPLDLDAIASIARQHQLAGQVTIKLPTRADGVFTVSNRAFLLRDQQVLHIDQYSGDIVKQLSWNDVGILMDLRQIFMRLHQGEYGLVNWILLLLVSLLFIFTTLGGLLSYLYRKPEGSWGIPKVPSRFKVSWMLLLIILLLGVIFPLFGLGVIFPLFGLSLLLLTVWGRPKKKAPIFAQG